MLFNSVEFIFGFLPIAALVFFGIARWSHPATAAWLALASLFFYGWWNWAYVPLLVASAAFNYGCGLHLARFVRVLAPCALASSSRASTIAVLLTGGALGHHLPLPVSVGWSVPVLPSGTVWPIRARSRRRREAQETRSLR